MGMMDTQIFKSDGPDSTVEIGAEIAPLLSFPGVVFLEGELGAGKTSLCKAIIHRLGYTGAVTSPTYNLIQEYPVEQGIIYHMDLYRLDDPTEIEFLGLEDLIGDSSLFLIEWPAKGRGYLPSESHQINIEKSGVRPNLLRQIILSTR